MTEAPFKGRFLVRNVKADFKSYINLVDLSMAGRALIARHNPEILTREFWSRPLSERAVTVQPRSLLEAYGSPHAERQVYGEIAAPELLHTDRLLSMGTYGNPRHEETFCKWIDGCANAILEANTRRRARLEQIQEVVDGRIEGWLGRLAGRAERDLNSVIQFDEMGWTIKFHAAAMAFRSVESDGMEARLRDMAEQRDLSLTEFLRQHPVTEKIATMADREMLTRATMAAGNEVATSHAWH